MTFTVVIPLYNKRDYVKKAVDSVLSQTYTDFELIIVNDGSTDGGEKIVEEIQDNRIRIIHQKNTGLPAARNTGIKNAQSQWITFLDADDIWFPDALECHYNTIKKHPDIKWCAGFNQEVNSDGTWKDRYFVDQVKDLYQNNLIKDSLLLLCLGQSVLQANVVCVNKDVFDNVGFHDEQLRNCEDIDMWLRIALKYPLLGHCNKVISKYYLDVPGSQVKNLVTKYKFTTIVLDKHKHLLNELPEIQKKALSGYMRKIIHNLFLAKLLSNDRKMAKSLIHKEKDIISFKQSIIFNLCLIMPILFTKFILQFKQKYRYLFSN